MECPGCRSSEMVAETYPGNYGASVVIDVCHQCNGLWFDGRESLSLSPSSTIQLFKSMHERQANARAPLDPRKHCPRCADALVETNDQVRATKFSYFRCATHGRYITFFQWLREKSLVRVPTPRELEKLRQQVQFVNCSNCGAPVSLNDAACTHCAAPVSILATETIEQTLRELSQKEIDRHTFKPEKLAEAMMQKAALEARYREERTITSIAGALGTGRGDLVSAGVSLVFDLLSGLL